MAQSSKPTSVKGVCEKLTVAGAEATARCAAKLSRMTLPDGTTFFIFADGPTMVGFSGEVSQIVRSGSASTLPVTFVNVGAPGKEPNAIPAKGACRWGDPKSEAAATVCTASTAQGTFEALFRASGVAGR